MRFDALNATWPGGRITPFRQPGFITHDMRSDGVTEGIILPRGQWMSVRLRLGSFWLDIGEVTVGPEDYFL